MYEIWLPHQEEYENLIELNRERELSYDEGTKALSTEKTYLIYIKKYAKHDLFLEETLKLLNEEKEIS